MPRSRSLPQLHDRLFLTDGGLETFLIHQQGVALPDFASFHLLDTYEGEALVRDYFRPYAAIARRHGTGLILDTLTWRASADWGALSGLSAADMVRINRRAVALLEELRDEFAPVPVVISGCLGPRGDGYVPGTQMTVRGAEAYHQPQVDALADAGADMLTAMTLNYVEEAVGITHAARLAAMPIAISFTVETNGRLPTGQSLGSAIRIVDAATSGYPSYYMVNCAHPSHFAHLLDPRESWVRRIRGIRANASCRSHAELNDAAGLDTGDPVALAATYAELRQRLPQLTVLGGCCGTDHRHVEAIAAACAPVAA
ncbi:homocysteine S-methyltransferase [Luteitalea sp. TBR-22]|uniref:homocysteine S-methyltransferase family protein n=1 Tax=Luteitalea sp. TBR-22 TaxID=2802971 RepID=UPI001AFA3B4D|nr:homocysteine S-methyltransferase family protein [Luteitalea sp. TBR-22]BCS35412.1 homocysteine S-methyltransferase [Luteitalea sp. TBR-22]